MEKICIYQIFIHHLSSCITLPNLHLVPFIPYPLQAKPHPFRLFPLLNQSLSPPFLFITILKEVFPLPLLPILIEV